MKISKSRLIQIIKEELHLSEVDWQGVDPKYDPMMDGGPHNHGPRRGRRLGAPKMPSEVDPDYKYHDGGRKTPHGPYKDLAAARSRDREELDPVDPHARAGYDETDFRALGSAALRGSSKALKSLKRLAIQHADAQAILDSVNQQLGPEAEVPKPGPGLSPDELDAAAMIDENILRKLVIEEFSKLIKL